MTDSLRAERIVAALFVTKGGTYFGLEGVDPWDETRDARLYAGPWPVVAHPPCCGACSGQVLALSFARLPYPDAGACLRCNGGGIEPGATWRCERCKGSGMEKT